MGGARVRQRIHLWHRDRRKLVVLCACRGMVGSTSRMIQEKWVMMLHHDVLILLRGKCSFSFDCALREHPVLLGRVLRLFYMPKSDLPTSADIAFIHV